MGDQIAMDDDQSSHSTEQAIENLSDLDTNDNPCVPPLTLKQVGRFLLKSRKCIK